MHHLHPALAEAGAYRAPRPHPLTLALACALATVLPTGQAAGQGLPAGVAVVQGHASVVTQGNQMTVTSSRDVVLNWQSFSIGAGQSVHFEQPSASSQVLNRVLGRDPSVIAGALSSNGGVWLLNPHGVMFGRSARVDVAGLVASTLNLADGDWQDRRFRLLGGNTTAMVVNQGEIRTPLGGQVRLVGGSAGVRNEGLIEAPGGQVLLAAGASVDLSDSATPGVAVRVSAPTGEALNLGRLLAPGGTIDLQAAMVNQQGIVRADGLFGGEGGEVRLTASEAVRLDARSSTSADGLQGGRITVQGPTALVAGAVGARGTAGSGGSVRLLGNEVGLLAGADVNASGTRGGGEVLVGGGVQGRDPAVPNAHAVYMDAGASVRADGGTRGDGGLIVLWSDSSTRAYGTLSARGGNEAGNGGFIETSGGWLDAAPQSIRTDAPRGLPGLWLLDPHDILITDGSAQTQNVTGGPNFRSTADSATIQMSTIVAALESGNSVTVTTANSSGSVESGTITVQGDMTVNPVSTVSFTLNAARHIDLSAVNIFALDVPLNLVLNAGTAGAGGVQVNGSSIQTTGNITIGGPSTACGTAGCATFPAAIGTTDDARGFGVAINGSTLSANRISIHGASAIDGQFHGGVFVDSTSVLSARQIEVSGWTGSTALSSQYGVLIEGQIAAVDRLTIDGTSRINGPGSGEGTAVGVYIGPSASLLVGPTAIGSGFGSGFSVTRDDPRRALAADPSRWLQITGRSDERSNMFTDSVSLDGSLWVSDKAGISIRGDGGQLTLSSSSFDASEAGNLLVSGSSLLAIYADDLLVPVAEPTRLTNTLGVDLNSSIFGNASAFVVDTPGLLTVAAGFSGVTLDLGTAALTFRGTKVEIGTEGNSVDAQAGTIRIQGTNVAIGPTAALNASSAGDAITVSGRAGNVSSLDIQGSGSPLVAPNGRWLVYATDPTNSANFQPGGLFQDFTQYDAVFGAAVQGSGNGVLFSLAPLLQVSASVQGSTSKTYNGTTSTSATLSGPALTGLLSGDSLLTTPSFGTLRYASADAAPAVALVVPLSGGPLEIQDSFQRPVYGYRFSGTGPGLFGSINPRGVTVDSLPSLNKVYDGTASVLLDGAILGGLVEGQTLTLLPGTVAFDTPNAGLGRTVAGTLALGDGPGGKASNYQLAAGGVLATTADITPRPLTLTGAAVADKIYDGTTAATITQGTLAGLIGSQTLTVTAGDASFDTKDAGLGKPVTGALSLADGANGGLAANYALPSGGPSLNLSGNILPRPVSLGTATASDKVYDGSTLAVVTTGPLQGLLPGEALSVVVEGRFQTPNVGFGKPVLATVTLQDGSGGLASNYAVPNGGLSTLANIQPRPVTAEGVTAADKPYDGTTTATLRAQTFVGLVPGETLSLAGQAQFDTPAVGSNKPVQGQIALADGVGLASNYTLTNPGAFAGTAAVVPRGLAVVSASAVDKVYDGTLSATVSNFRLDGVLPGEQVSVSSGSGAFANGDVGVAKPVTATAASLAGVNSGNYVLASPSVLTQASISPATLTYVATPTNVALGQAVPVLTGAVSGFVAGETLPGATSGELRFSTSATETSTEGRYPVLGEGLSARNYVFTQAPANATALRVVRSSTSSIGEPTSTVPTVPTLVAGVQPTPVVSSVGAHRALDVTPALQSAPPIFVFGALDLEGTGEQRLAALLTARDRYKKSIFADAIGELEGNPAAADAPACQTVEQAAAGNCLITEALKPALRERLRIQQQEFAQRAPEPLAAPDTQPVPTQPPVTAAPSQPAATAPQSPAQELPAVTAPVVAAALAQPSIAAVSPVRLPVARAVRSAALPQIQRKWALLIGTDVYADPRIPGLDNAVADVNAVGKLFEEQLGYQTLIVRNGRKADILRAFNELAAVVDPADSVAIYYAGHGELIEKIGLGFWQPADADPSKAQTWLSNTDIGKLMGQLGASQVALVSDSCFSGSFVSEERIRSSAVPLAAATLLSRRAAVVMSSGGNEPVFDSGKNGHSPFAWSLMQTLKEVSTWRPGSNVFERVRFDVARQLPQRPQYGASRLGGHQSGSDYVFEQRQLDTRSQ
jgi:filamentous hemagglutinin family protein